MLEILQISAAANSKGLYVTNSGGAANNYAAIFDQGYVGIGTTGPGAKLHVVGTSQNTLALESPSYPELTFRVGGVIKSYDAIATSAGGYFGTSGAGDRIYRSESGNHLFGYGATELMRIATTGNVGIGTTAPGTLLDLGLAGTKKGVVRLAGNTSGNVTIQPAAAAGTWALTLPPTPGNNGEVLTTDGGGISTWTVPTVSSTCTAYIILVSINSTGSGCGSYDPTTCPAGWTNVSTSFTGSFNSGGINYYYCNRLCSK